MLKEQIELIADRSVSEILSSISSEGGRPWKDIIVEAINMGIKIHENQNLQLDTKAYKPVL